MIRKSNKKFTKKFTEDKNNLTKVAIYLKRDLSVLGWDPFLENFLSKSSLNSKLHRFKCKFLFHLSCVWINYLLRKKGKKKYRGSNGSQRLNSLTFLFLFSFSH